MVHFDADAHTYHLDGCRYPAVGDVMKATGLSVDYGMIAPNVLETARDRGSRIHKSIELRLMGMHDYPVAPDTAPYLEAFEKFMREANPTVIASEEPMIHLGLLYAGTPDLVCSLTNRTVMIDIKNTSTVNVKSCSMQIAGAYAPMWDVNNPDRWIERCLVLHLKPTGKYALVNVGNPLAPNVFAAALREYYGEGDEFTAAAIRQWMNS